MKNLKKYLTFTNCIAIFSFITLMLFFTPCITLHSPQGTTEPDHILNLFKAMFGTTVPLPIYGVGAFENPITIHPCAGLIIAFVFLIIGILLSVGKNKNKWLGFAATAFYITSGVLIACAVPLIKGSNYTLSSGTYRIGYYGWTIAIATLICFSGFCQFINTVASFSKPKVQEVY